MGFSGFSIIQRLEAMGAREDAEELCRFYGVSVSEMMSGGRARPILLARHSVWDLLHARGWSGAAIATAWGVHHTTVNEALKKKARRRDEGGDPAPR